MYSVVFTSTQYKTPVFMIRDYSSLDEAIKIAKSKRKPNEQVEIFLGDTSVLILK